MKLSEIKSCVNTECFNLKILNIVMLYLCLISCPRLICFVLNCYIVLRHLAKIEALRIYCGGLRTAVAAAYIDAQPSRSQWKHTH